SSPFHRCPENFGRLRRHNRMWALRPTPRQRLSVCQRPEPARGQRSNAGGHNPKPPVVEPADWIVPATTGAPHGGGNGRPPAPAGNPAILHPCVLTPVPSVVGIGETRLVPVVASPPRARPLIDVACHVQHAIRAGTRPILPYRRR